MNKEQNRRKPKSIRNSSISKLMAKPSEAANKSSSGEFKDMSFRVDAERHYGSRRQPRYTGSR